MSGRACWGGNKDLRDTREEASNVITRVKLQRGAVAKRTLTHTLALVREGGETR